MMDKEVHQTKLFYSFELLPKFVRKNKVEDEVDDGRNITHSWQTL